jgi:hypothetical protein
MRFQINLGPEGKWKLRDIQSGKSPTRKICFSGKRRRSDVFSRSHAIALEERVA